MGKFLRGLEMPYMHRTRSVQSYNSVKTTLYHFAVYACLRVCVHVFVCGFILLSSPALTSYSIVPSLSLSQVS